MREIGNLGAKILEAQEKKADKEAKKDPFRVETSLEELDAKLEDPEEAKKRAEAEAVRQADIAAKAGEFAQTIFPVMAGLVERREKSRGISDKNVRECDAHIELYIGRPVPAGAIAATAYVLAAIKAKGGVRDSERLVDDLLERGLVKEAFDGPISRGKGRFSLAFQPMEQHRAVLLQALRERFGEAEREARQKYGQAVRDLLATDELTIWELFPGKKAGRWAYFCPFASEPVEFVKDGKKQKGERKRFPGPMAGETDGSRITFNTGLGGAEKHVQAVHEGGYFLTVEALRDPEWRPRYDDRDLNVLIPVHRRLWDVKRQLESQGQGPDAEKAVADLASKGQVKPETFFGDNKPRETLIVFEGAWKVYSRDGAMRDGDKRYSPVYNVAAVLSRDKDGTIFWKKAVPHLKAAFRDAIGKFLEADEKGKKVVFGLPMALYSWAKRKYGPAGE
ncbi:MAG: hypothetical protein COT67_00750 [Candidatus Tagabacteria bacterium CG09_land_8_20_14_0_10_41_14]|uniref:Uncharacterized protein n=2 Tax=Candidatus Tagaibacteriota TaxID=1817918 RepID=A0A2H0WLV1_9BACT|nr:MAG: hypothetical protein COT67_00750 [Candidatus Tagabacteria bacterium CG09_land_8_20_14_0_10_41_14]